MSRRLRDYLAYVALLLGVVSVSQSVGRVQLKFDGADEVNKVSFNKITYTFNNSIYVSRVKKSLPIACHNFNIREKEGKHRIQGIP